MTKKFPSNPTPHTIPSNAARIALNSVIIFSRAVKTMNCSLYTDTAIVMRLNSWLPVLSNAYLVMLVLAGRKGIFTTFWLLATKSVESQSLRDRCIIICHLKNVLEISDYDLQKFATAKSPECCYSLKGGFAYESPVLETIFRFACMLIFPGWVVYQSNLPSTPIPILVLYSAAQAFFFLQLKHKQPSLILPTITWNSRFFVILSLILFRPSFPNWLTLAALLCLSLS